MRRSSNIIYWSDPLLSGEPLRWINRNSKWPPLLKNHPVSPPVKQFGGSAAMILTFGDQGGCFEVLSWVIPYLWGLLSLPWATSIKGHEGSVDPGSRKLLKYRLHGS